jgi:hypothetical protein
MRTHTSMRRPASPSRNRRSTGSTTIHGGHRRSPPPTALAPLPYPLSALYKAPRAPFHSHLSLSCSLFAHSTVPLSYGPPRAHYLGR